MLPATAAALAVLAALLAWPVPALLARARWPRRDPVAALVCWQAVGLAGGLSIIGALLVHGLAPGGDSLPEAWWHWVTRHPAEQPVRGDHWVAQTLAAVLAAELLGVLVLSWGRPPGAAGVAGAVGGPPPPPPPPAPRAARAGGAARRRDLTGGRLAAARAP